MFVVTPLILQPHSFGCEEHLLSGWSLFSLSTILPSHTARRMALFLWLAPVSLSVGTSPILRTPQRAAAPFMQAIAEKPATATAQRMEPRSQRVLHGLVDLFGACSLESFHRPSSALLSRIRRPGSSLCRATVDSSAASSATCRPRAARRSARDIEVASVATRIGACKYEFRVGTVGIPKVSRHVATRVYRVWSRI